MDIHEKFLEVLNDLLNEEGISRWQFAERSGIPYTTVVGWTNLGRLPDFAALIKIADFFDCSVDYLMGRMSDFVKVHDSEPKNPKLRVDTYGLRKEDVQLLQTIANRLKKGLDLT